MTYKCRECEFVAGGNTGWDALVNHWIEEHPAEYAKVQQWLDDDNDKLIQVEKLAGEGMKGAK